jgi:uncharacterized membrane protein
VSTAARAGAAAAVGLCGAFGLGLLLHRLVFAGWAHSFDSAIYVRSLWGVAHGAWWNPVVDLHVLSIHCNLVLFALAPLVGLVSAAGVLVGAQAAAWGATLGLAARAASTDAAAHGRRTGLLAGLAAAALVAASPLVTNAFLFDVRPDLIGVPLLVAGLLRLRRRGRVDAWAAALLFAAIPVREEHMMVVVGAMAALLAAQLRPSRGDGGEATAARPQWAAATSIAVAAIAAWAIYFFGVRALIGDGSAELAREVAGDFLDEGRGIWAARAEAVALVAVAGGGLALVGWRWLIAAGPGLLLLLATTRMAELALNFHYVMFLAPGVVVAIVDGLSRVGRWPRARLRAAVLAAAALLAGAAFLSSSALPGGGRFRAENFALLLDETTALRPDDLPELEAMYALLSRVPPGAALAAPWEILAPFAERAQVATSADLGRRLRSGGADLAAFDFVALAGRDWADLGSRAVAHDGFAVVGRVGSRLALLQRDGTVDWDAVGDGGGDCSDDAGAFAAAGLRICGARFRDGEVAIALDATAGADLPRDATLWAVPPGASEPRVPLRALEGLVPVHALIHGRSVRFVSSTPIDAAAVDVIVVAGGVERGRASIRRADTPG